MHQIDVMHPSHRAGQLSEQAAHKPFALGQLARVVACQQVEELAAADALEDEVVVLCRGEGGEKADDVRMRNVLGGRHVRRSALPATCLAEQQHSP
jgi:phosphoheptose isomerase